MKYACAIEKEKCGEMQSGGGDAGLSTREEEKNELRLLSVVLLCISVRRSKVRN